MRLEDTDQAVTDKDAFEVSPRCTGDGRRKDRCFLEGVLDVVLPRQCVLCGTGLGKGTYHWFCEACAAGIPTPPARCPKCALPFQSEVALAHSPEHICGDCRRGVHRFAKAHAVGTYEGCLRELIHMYKYGGKVRLKDDLVTLLLERTEVTGDRGAYDVLLHVPIHSSKVASREFDQAHVLAREFSRRTGIPHLEGVLERTRATAPQVGLSRAERRRNMRGAFRVSRPGAILNRRVLLVDDVITSGATVNECTRELKRAGASRVEVLALARAT